MALEDDITLLKKAPIFCSLEQDALRLLAFAAENLVLDAGEVLFSYGDYSDGGYVVRSGEILIESPLDGHIMTAHSRDLIGQTALFTRITRTATATAQMPSELIRVSTNLMKRCLQEYPSGADIIYSVMADDLQKLTQKMLIVKDRYLDD